MPFACLVFVAEGLFVMLELTARGRGTPSVPTPPLGQGTATDGLGR